MNEVKVIYHTPFDNPRYIDAMTDLELKGLDPVEIVTSIIVGIHMSDLYFTRNRFVMKHIHSGLGYVELHNQYLTIEQCIGMLVRPLPLPDSIVIAQMNQEGFIVDYVY